MSTRSLAQDPGVAVVTGASSGIGEASARRLAAGGFTVVIAARRGERLARLAERIAGEGGRAVAVACDLAEAAETSALVERVVDELGRVDVLVNNAGYGPPFALEQMDRAAVRHVFDVNLIAGMQLISELTPLWREQGGARVVNMSSLTRYVAAPIASAYAASKAGMEAMSDCLRLELAPWKVRFSVIVPGFVDTPTFDTARETRRAADEAPDQPYRALMDHLDAFATEQLARAARPDQVAEAVWRAATDAHPRHRYFVPGSARATALAFGALPPRTVERILRKLYRW